MQFAADVSCNKGPKEVRERSAAGMSCKKGPKEVWERRLADNTVELTEEGQGNEYNVGDKFHDGISKGADDDLSRAVHQSARFRRANVLSMRKNGRKMAPREGTSECIIDLLGCTLTMESSSGA